MAVEEFYHKTPHLFDDLDGDGGLDALVVNRRFTTGIDIEHTLLAISLRDGKKLWSQALRLEPQIDSVAERRVGDIDGDERPEVAAVEHFGDDGKKELTVRVFDGRDGKVRWIWNSRFARQSLGMSQESIALANLDGNGTQNVCVSFVVRRLFQELRRIVVLDGYGKERARRNDALAFNNALEAVDLNGDGRDELLILDHDLDSVEGRVCALDRELKELWTWPPRSKGVERPIFDPLEMLPLRAQHKTIDRILPASRGRVGAVIISPGLAIDLATGRPRWTGQASLVDSGDQFRPMLLDPGDSNRLPLLIGNGLGATVCRVALPTTAGGAPAAPRGTLVAPGRTLRDPRWTKPLPWRAWLKGYYGPTAFLVAACLALVNVVLPLLILRLAAGGRRVFRMRALMVVPIAAAVPLMAILILAPWLPVGDQRWLATEWRVFLAGTLAGVPILLYVAWMAASLVRRRPRAIVALGGLTVVVTLVVAGGGWGRMARHEVDGGYRALRPGGVVPGGVTGGLLRRDVVGWRAGGLGNLQVGEAPGGEWVK
jgi:hypothetical protein